MTLVKINETDACNCNTSELNNDPKCVEIYHLCAIIIETDVRCAVIYYALHRDIDLHKLEVKVN